MIMHYCVLLITKEFPSESEIDEIMQPYCDNNIEYDEDTGESITPRPIFTWDWYQIGGRYAGEFKLRVDDNDEEYRWGFCIKDNRNNRLFHSSLLSKLERGIKANGRFYFEEDYFPYMGIRDNFLYVDGAKIDDLLNFDDVNCYICIDSDGKVIVREEWDGHDFIKDEKFDDKLADIKKNSKGMFATILDIHD